MKKKGTTIVLDTCRSMPQDNILHIQSRDKLEYAKALGVGNIILDPKVSKWIEPSFSTDDSTILEAFFFPVLTIESLKAKISLRTLVCLYVVLSLWIHIPTAPFGLDLVRRQA